MMRDRYVDGVKYLHVFSQTKKEVLICVNSPMISLFAVFPCRKAWYYIDGFV